MSAWRINLYIYPAIYLVIPAAAKRRAGSQKKQRYYWVPAFAGMTGWGSEVAVFHCQVSSYRYSASNGIMTENSR